MIRSILGFALIAIAVAVTLTRKRLMANQNNSSDAEWVGGVTRIVGIVLAVVGVLLTSWSFARVVPAGHVGVKVCVGKVHLDEQPAGLTLTAPWCRVQNVEVRAKVYAMVQRSNEGQEKGDDSLGVTSSDNVQLSADVSVVYHLDATKAAEIYKGVSSVETLIRSEARTAVRDAGAGFNAVDIIGAKRAEVGVAAQNVLAERLKPYGVIVESTQIREVRPLDEAFAKAIAEKVSKQQAAQAKQYELESAQRDAEIARTRAQGEADAQRIRNSVDPTAAQLELERIRAIKPTDKVILTDGKTPVIVNPAAGK